MCVVFILMLSLSAVFACTEFCIGMGGRGGGGVDNRTAIVRAKRERFFMCERCDERHECVCVDEFVEY